MAHRLPFRPFFALRSIIFGVLISLGAFAFAQTSDLYRVEAESYSSMAGVQVETSWDNGEAEIVSWISPGDYLTYDLDVSQAGEYQVTFRYASDVGVGGALSFFQEGKIIAQTTLPSSGGWGTWGESETTISLEAGAQSLMMFVDQGWWNLNWIELERIGEASSSSSSSQQLIQVDGVTHVEAEDYTLMSGVQTEPSWDEATATIASWIDPGDYLIYSLDVDVQGLHTFTYRYASDAGGGIIHLFAGDTLVDVVELPSTGGWGSWGEIQSTAVLPAGETDLIIMPQQGGWNLNWFEISPNDDSSSSASSSEQSSSSSTLSSSSVASSNSSAPSSSENPVVSRVQAESFTSMAGVEVESSWDEGPTNIVSWTDPGDYLSYMVEVEESGLYSMKFRYVSASGGGRLTILRGDDLLGVVGFPSTGGWGSWGEVELIVDLNAGENELEFFIDHGGWNLNWFEVTSFEESSSSSTSSSHSSVSSSSSSSVSFRIEAEDYTAQNGLQVASTTDELGGMDLINIDSGDRAQYLIDIPESGNYKLSFRVAAEYAGYHFKFHDYSGVLEIVDVDGTGIENWDTVERSVVLPAGEYSVYIDSISTGWRLNYIDFELIEPQIDAEYLIDEKEPLFTVEAENYLYNSGGELIADESASGSEALSMVSYPGWTGYHFTTPSTDKYRVSYTVKGLEVEGDGSVYVEMAFDAHNGTEVYTDVGDWFPSSEWSLIESIVSLDRGGKPYNLTNRSAGWSIDNFTVEALKGSEYSGPYSVNDIIPAENYFDADAVYHEKSPSTETGWSIRYIPEYLEGVKKYSAKLQYPINVENSGDYLIVVKALSTSGDYGIAFGLDDEQNEIDDIDVSTNAWRNKWINFEVPVSLNEGDHTIFVTLHDENVKLDTIKIIPLTPSLDDEAYAVSVTPSDVQLIASSSDVRRGSSIFFELETPSGFWVEDVVGCEAFRGSRGYGFGWWTSPIYDDCEIEVILRPVLSGAKNIEVLPGDQSALVYWDEVPNAESYDIFVSDHILTDIYEFGVEQGVVKFENVTSPAEIYDLSNAQEYFIYVVPKNGPYRAIGGAGGSTTTFIPSGGSGIIDNRFEARPGGVVLDLVTGYQWKRCSFGNQWNGSECIGEKQKISSDDDISIGDPTNDWRAARVLELNTLVYCSSGDRWFWRPFYTGFILNPKCEGEFSKPTINTTVFPDVNAGLYLADTSSGYNTDYVSFNDGGEYYSRTDLGYALLVKGPLQRPDVLKLNVDGSGFVTSYPEAINCPGTCNYWVGEQSPIVLTAEAAAGSEFSHWDGVCDGQDETCEISGLSQEETTTAYFESTVPDRFMSVSPGVVWDRWTGKEWEQCAYGRSWDGAECVGDETPLIWAELQSVTDGRWRVPTAEEFSEIIYCRSGDPSEWGPNDSGCVDDGELFDLYMQQGWALTIDRNYFLGSMRGPYWTSTSIDGGTAVSVDLLYGSRENVSKGLHGAVYRVRDRAIDMPVSVSGEDVEISAQDSLFYSEEFVSYRWVDHFTGEEVSAGVDVTLVGLSVGRHVYDLIAIDNNGQEYVESYVINIANSPQIIVIDNQTVYEDRLLTVDASNSFVDEGTITFEWIYNGNTVSHSPILEYQFSTLGIKEIELVVTTNMGLSESQLILIDVVELDEAHTPTVIAPDSISSLVYKEVDLFAGDSYVANGTVSFLWQYNGEVVSDSDDLVINFVEAGQHEIELTVTSSFGVSVTKIIDVEVSEIISDFAACPYAPVAEDVDYNHIYPEDNIPWLGEKSGNVEDIQRAFNFARMKDPSIHQYLVMPSQIDWDAMSLQQKGLFLVNAERVARGIKPHAGYDASVVDVIQDYTDYILDSNIDIDHYYLDSTPTSRLFDHTYIQSNADLYIAKSESLFQLYGNTSPIADSHAIAFAVYNWIYADKDWFLDFGLSSGNAWGHRDHLLQTGLQENQGEITSEGVIGFSVSKGLFDPDSASPATYGSVVGLNTIDQGTNWDQSRIGVVDVSQAQGCIPYAIDLPEGDPVLQGLTGLRLEPSNMHLALGQSSSVSIIGQYDDGTEQDLTSLGVLTSNDQSVVSVEAGSVSALQPGPAKVYAQFGDIESNRLYVTVGSPVNVSSFIGTNAEIVAPYLAGNATLPELLSFTEAGSTTAKFNPKAMAVYTGVVTDRYGVPLHDVQVSLLDAKNYGSVVTDNDGRFILTGPAGEQTVVYEKSGYVVVQRTLIGASSEWAVVNEVSLLPRDSKMTHIDLTSGLTQVHQSTPIVDEHGERKTTLVFNGVSSATIQSVDGELRPLEEFDLSATDFETPESMPGELPKEVAFTWASDFHIEGTHYADVVMFDKNVSVFVDNFLNFEVGEIIPVGYYNRRTAFWDAEDNAVVVMTLDSSGDGTIDGLDYTGDGLPDDLNGNGSTADEAVGLIGYSPGVTLWWASVSHFSAYDLNQGQVEDKSPEKAKVETGEQSTDNNATCCTGSYLKAFQQTFHEDIPVAGTNLTLHYASQRTQGYKHKIRVPVSGSEVPTTLLAMIAKLEIAGRVYEQRFLPESNVEAEFIWDGTAVDGSQISGLVRGKVSIGFEYQTVYTSPGNAANDEMALNEYPRAWATVSDITTQVPGRSRYVAWQSSGITVKNTFDRQLAEGWSLSNVHELDPSGKVYLGHGTVTEVPMASLILITGQTFSYIDGDDGYYQAGGNTVDYSISDENVLIDNVTGLEWQNTFNPYLALTKSEAADYCANDAEPLDSGWRLPTNKEVGYTIDKSGGTSGSRVYSMAQAFNKWHQSSLSTYGKKVPTVCVRGTPLDIRVVSGLQRDSSKEVVIDQDNGLMWQDSSDNTSVVLGWEGSVDYCEASIHAGYDNWRLPNVNELLYVLPNDVFENETSFTGLWGPGHPDRNPYWSSTTNIQNEEQAWAVESISYNSQGFDKLDAYNVRCVREDASASRSPFIFNNKGQHTKTIDMASGVTLNTFGYNNAGQVISITDRFNNETKIERDFSGVPDRIIAPDGETTWLLLDENNDLKEVSYEDGNHFSFSYREGGLLTSKVDRRDNTYTRQYDTLGRIEEVWDPASGFWEVYDNRIATGTSQYGYLTAENNRYEVTRQSLANGDVQTTSASKAGAIRTITVSADELSETVSAYGMTAQITSELDTKTLRPTPSQVTVTTPSGIVRTGAIDKEYAENGADTLTYTLTATLNGKSTTLVKNGHTGVTNVTTPEGRTSTSYTDPESLTLSRSVVPGLNDVLYRYDTRGRLMEVESASRITTYNYDDVNKRGKLSSVVTPDNRETFYDYDVMGRVSEITYDDSYTTQFSYDENGNTTKVTVPTLAEHDFAYNKINEVKTQDRPEFESTQYTYNGEGQVKKITLPSGNTIDYEYSQGKLFQVIRPESTTEYRYQLGDQLDEVQTGTELVDYSYDGTLLIQKRYQGELNAAIDYTYNADFAVDTLTYAGDTTAIGYDNDGLVTSIHGFTLSYNGLNGLPENINNGSWSQSRSWTPYGEVDDVQYTQGSNTNYAYNLDYNDAGQIIQKTEMLSGGTQDTYVYGYDARNRLTEVQKNGAVVESYGYDANGNRNLRTSTELGVINQTATHNNADQLETQGNVTYSFDSNARLSEKLMVDGENSELTTYVYDSAGRLKQVDTPDKSITYRHNALGNRVAKLVDGVLVEKYLWQDLTTLLATYDGQGNLKQRFEHTLGHTPTSFTQGGQRYFIQTDHLGSPRVVTDNSGAVIKSIGYDSYGVVIEDSNPAFKIPFGFAGGLYDADTGLVRFGFRDYDPDIGRWTARDPIGFGGGDTNLYGYVSNNPIQFVDLNGLQADLNGGRHIPYAGSTSTDVLMTEHKVGTVLDTSNFSGEYVVFGHGNTEIIHYKYERSASNLADVMRRKGWIEGQSVRLVSCSTGSDPNGIAQQLADILKVDVTAPTDFVWVGSDGSIMGVYPTDQNGKADYSNPGSWQTFSPSK
ncbi:carbohydrate-binding protein [Gilvimarinus polysaccharolyticus]|uniref:carbohydrate-binding protein n=1 Tax=Gilvimarinus polysaccharolyticus TaxID=863921 RepID=UPI000673B08E|nr:carbohydrate-binding protein [Gilvimarinus polysaccharolyticus]